MIESLLINRRKFLGNTARLVAATSALPLYSFAGDKTHVSPVKLKLALVGTGNRGTYTWGKPVLEAYGDRLEMVGLCDINPKRVAFSRSVLGINVKTYEAKDFDLMIRETRPDIVIVTTTDCFHEKYTVRAMELGCNVISEKPIAIDADQCQRIADAESRTGRKVIVGFNARHENQAIEMKKILLSGELGKIIAVDYHECLNTSHGADYYRRWHGKMMYSGSLLLHKASHYFDLVNWLLDSEPVDVQAVGNLKFYGHNHDFRGRNCRTCPFTQQCKFYWDMTKDSTSMAMYADCEDADGYYRDGCVWANEIDIYDTHSVQVNYENEAQLTYTMHSFLPYEGQYICFSGEKGRLDVRLNAVQPWEVPNTYEFRLTRDRETSRFWTLGDDVGTHGGADQKLQDAIFLPGTADPLSSRADSRAGIMSSLIGFAARRSIETGQKIKISDLIRFPQVWRG
jgi:predicted dehydrogenase